MKEAKSMKDRGLDDRAESRRDFLSWTIAAGLGLGAWRPDGGRPDASLDPRLAARLAVRFRALIMEQGQPGYAAGLIREGRLVWAGGFGFADVDAGIPMTPKTVQNVGSVSKTVTTTAVLQLVEQGRLDLDADVNKYLSFAVRNPHYPDAPITARQLLVHRSSVKDGRALAESYRCGDHPGPLGRWLSDYFSGPDLESNFHTWAPGEANPPKSPRAYSNVAYGLLGHLVETVSGLDFADYCRRSILAPLGMRSSSFRVRDVSHHAVPYFNRVPIDFNLEKDRKDWAWDETIARFPFKERPPIPGQLFAYCTYSFGTPPDGGLRTGVNDLSRFWTSWIDHGRGQGPGGRPAHLLRPETIDMALSPIHFGRMLCWDRLEGLYSSKEPLPGEPWVYHDGSDPGIGALAAFRPRQRSGMILVFNSSGKTRELLDGGIRALLEALEEAQ
jgi:CubicO group peptidase (beta-lactamase class C family)